MTPCLRVLHFSLKARIITCLSRYLGFCDPQYLFSLTRDAGYYKTHSLNPLPSSSQGLNGTVTSSEYILILWKFSMFTYCVELLCVFSLPFFGIHSFSSLSYDRSKASSKASSSHSAIQSFLFQMRVSSPFLKVIQ
jgi:hypothetical protein